jgi:hypothetical protein
MPKLDVTTAGDRILTVGQLKEWLKPFPDHHPVLGVIHGQPGINLFICSHSERHVIVEVPRRLEQ